MDSFEKGICWYEFRLHYMELEILYVLWSIQGEKCGVLVYSGWLVEI